MRRREARDRLCASMAGRQGRTRSLRWLLQAECALSTISLSLILTNLTALWPLFHYLLWQDVASEQSQASAYYQYYVQANRTFAEKICETYRPGDLIWIHDYHLLLVPSLLRQSLPDAAVGLFVHTPFPSSEIFRCLPKRREVLDGMLGANLVVFQTYSYARHFTSSCIRVCGYETAAKGIDNQGHITTVAHCPVGVDAERIMRDSQRPGIEPKRQALRDLYEGKKIIVARDKLDVVKGIVQKVISVIHEYMSNQLRIPSFSFAPSSVSSATIPSGSETLCSSRSPLPR